MLEESNLRQVRNLEHIDVIKLYNEMHSMEGIKRNLTIASEL